MSARKDTNGRVVERGVIVARIKDGAQDEVARIFAESDATELPGLVGVRHRSLFVLDDVYIHLVETDRDFDAAVDGIRTHELFREVSEKLEPYVEPYNPETWRSPRDASAREFYSWDAPEQTPQPAKREPATKSVEDAPPNTRRGGDIRTLLSPNTVGSTSGFSGVATIPAGDRISEHFHPYSEEFVYLVRGTLRVDLEGEPTELSSGHGLYIPIGVRHRFVNQSDEEAFLVFFLSPLAPRPELGHVDTE